MKQKLKSHNPDILEQSIRLIDEYHFQLANVHLRSCPSLEQKRRMDGGFRSKIALDWTDL